MEETKKVSCLKTPAMEYDKTTEELHDTRVLPSAKETFEPMQEVTGIFKVEITFSCTTMMV